MLIATVKDFELKRRSKTASTVLDVGCGSRPIGDVNVDFFRGGQNLQEGDQQAGEYLNPHVISNFVVADAGHLPFRSEVFVLVFSSHTIEHVPDPFRMFTELCRVSRRKVVIRCPHRLGSGAKRPFHVNYFNSEWFKNAADKIGYRSVQFTSVYDFPVTRFFSRFLNPKAQKINWYWRIIRHVERRTLKKKILIPYDIECQVYKQPYNAGTLKTKFVVVYNDLQTLNKCFFSSVNINAADVIPYENLENESLPKLFNRIINKTDLSKDFWVVFCHQDFILKENLPEKLKTLDTSIIYGVIGARFSQGNFFGSVIQTDGSTTGVALKKPAPVQTLDEICLIMHSSLFREGLRFDERFCFHFYGADVCLQAYMMGFGVYAVQMDCQHKSKTGGDIHSDAYHSDLKLFVDKWKKHLPVRTTTMECS